MTAAPLTAFFAMFIGETFRFNPKGVASLESSNLQIKSEVLLANFTLAHDHTFRDIVAMLCFIGTTLMATFLVLYNSKFRR
jgi:hypothetical protein